MPRWWITHIAVAVLLLTSLFSCCFHTIDVSKAAFWFPVRRWWKSPSSTHLWIVPGLWIHMDFRNHNKMTVKNVQFQPLCPEKSSQGSSENYVCFARNFCPAIKRSSGKNPSLPGFSHSTSIWFGDFPVGLRSPDLKKCKKKKMPCFYGKLTTEALPHQATKPCLMTRSRVCPSLLLHIPLAVMMELVPKYSRVLVKRFKWQITLVAIFLIVDLRYGLVFRNQMPSG